MATPQDTPEVKPAAQPVSPAEPVPAPLPLVPPSVVAQEEPKPAPPSAQSESSVAQPPPSAQQAATGGARAFQAVPQGNVEPDTITRDPMVDLSALVNAGRIEDTVEVFGYQIRMHTLRADENTEALAAVAHMGDTAGANALMVQVLSRAVDTINGVPLEDIYSGNQQSRVAKRVELVSAFQQTFLTRLWDRYTALMDRSTALAEESEEPLKNL